MSFLRDVTNDDSNDSVHDEELRNQLSADDIILQFNDDMKEILTKIGCIIYFIIGFILSLATVAKELDLQEDNGIIVITLFNSLFIVCYFVNFLFIIYNHFKNATTSTDTVSVKDHLLVFILLLPLTFIVTVSSILRIVQLAMFPNNVSTSTIMMNFFFIIFVALVSVLAMDQCRIRASQSEVTLDMSMNKSTILMTTVGLLVTLIIVTTQREVILLKKSNRIYYNVSYSNRPKSSKPFNILNEFLFPFRVAFLLISLTIMCEFLLELLNKEGPLLSKAFSNASRERRQLNIPIRALILGLVIVIVPVISLLLMNNIGIPLVSSIISYMSAYVLYGLGILLSVIQLREMKHWPLTDPCNRNIAEKTLIWLGGVGETIYVFCQVSVQMQSLSEGQSMPRDKYNVLVRETCFIIVNLVCLVAHLILQNVIMEVSLSRIPGAPSTMAAKRYCPSLSMFCINASCLIIVIYLSSTTKFDTFTVFSINIFHGGLHLISNSLSLLYRFYGCVFFGTLLSKVRE